MTALETFGRPAITTLGIVVFRRDSSAFSALPCLAVSGLIINNDGPHTVTFWGFTRSFDMHILENNMENRVRI